MNQPVTNRRQQLAQFLRHRRESLRPEDVNLPTGQRRRTPGLRREEVALLAGVGVTWYTWLEQGRDINISESSMNGIARALQLSGEDRQHVYTLAQLPVPIAKPAMGSTVPAMLQVILDTLEPLPAYATNVRWDIVAWNKAASDLYTDFGTLPTEERNILRFMFTDAAQRKRLVEWQKEAKNVIALFRQSTAAFVDEAWFIDLVGDLQAHSPEFKEWWHDQKVIAARNTPKLVRHPKQGILAFHVTTLAVQDIPGLRLVVQTPVDNKSRLSSNAAR